jgi:excinuclease ABC subunit C
MDINIVPQTIACVDISNLQGKHTVGAVVVFKNGRPMPRWYRTYNLGEAIDQNDPLMIQLTIKHLAKEDTEIFKEIDLLMIDGGKGQLQGAMKALETLKSEGISEESDRPVLVAIAKERSGERLERLFAEKIYLPHKPEPIPVSEHPQVLNFLQRIRDEAHRCALGAYQRAHRRSLKSSILDAIQGVGPRRKQLLLKRFGDVEAISRARLEDLLAIPGIPEEVAKNIYELFHPAR